MVHSDQGCPRCGVLTVRLRQVSVEGEQRVVRDGGGIGHSTPAIQVRTKSLLHECDEVPKCWLPGSQGDDIGEGCPCGLRLRECLSARGDKGFFASAERLRQGAVRIDETEDSLPGSRLVHQQNMRVGDPLEVRLDNGGVDPLECVGVQTLDCGRDINGRRQGRLFSASLLRPNLELGNCNGLHRRKSRRLLGLVVPVRVGEKPLQSLLLQSGEFGHKRQ